MPDSPPENSIARSTTSPVQLSLPIAPLALQEAEGQWEIVVPESPIEVQQRIEVIQQLIAAQGTEQYGKLQQQSAKKLGMSIRSLQRLMKRWREQGLSALSKRYRVDQGAVRISLEWRDFILKTYREGNRGSRSMTPAQVALRVKVHAQELGVAHYPSRTTVYRILQPQIEKQQAKRSLGWRGDRLLITTREGIELAIEWSNQVWQCDHTKIDVLVVDQAGEILGRPWLTIVVDTYSRCIMGLHLGFDAPSAQVVGLALRHAILPKQYPAAYELQQVWDTYGLPRYLYTDGGKDFRSQHLEQVATELGIVLCLRRKPSDGGIVERPFGTFNREFFSTLPGYVSSNVMERSSKAETEACLTLLQVERLLVRYVVDHYNQAIDARMGDQTRLGRWEAGRMAQLPLLGERELDLCLMRRDQRTVYIWFMGGQNNTSISAIDLLDSVPTNWQIGGIADFNGDNRPDILWRNYSNDIYSGMNAIWFMGGQNNTSINAIAILDPASTDWQIGGIADFNGDNRPDILWRNYGTAGYSGTNAIWFMGGQNNTSISAIDILPDVPTNWRPTPFLQYGTPPQIDSAGNFIETAFDIGTLNGSATYSEFVGSTDSDDYYRFNLNTASNFNLLLSGLTGNADVQLLNSSGAVLRSLSNLGNNSESFNFSLSAGTYYVKVNADVGV